MKINSKTILNLNGRFDEHHEKKKKIYTDYIEAFIITYIIALVKERKEWLLQ